MREKDMILKFEKVVNKDKEKMYKFTSFEGVFCGDDLPTGYIQKDKASFWTCKCFCDSVYFYTHGNGRCFIINDILSTEEVDDFMNIVEQGCKRLKKINNEIRKTKKSWHGEFEIHF